MRSIKGFAAIAIVGWVGLTLVSGTSLAEERVLTLDPGASRVTFLLGATGHDVEGSFALSEGEIRFDPATGAASGVIEVAAGSGETGNDKRDKTMHNKVLESATFPLFVFRLQRIEGQVPEAGTGQVTLHGTMSVLGHDHPMALPATVTIDDDRVTAHTEFPVPFVEWGMHDPSFLFLRVAKSVDVSVEAVGRIVITERGDATSHAKP